MGYTQTDSVFILDMKANNNEYIDDLCEYCVNYTHLPRTMCRRP